MTTNHIRWYNKAGVPYPAAAYGECSFLPLQRHFGRGAKKPFRTKSAAPGPSSTAEIHAPCVVGAAFSPLLKRVCRWFSLLVARDRAVTAATGRWRDSESLEMLNFAVLGDHHHGFGVGMRPIGCPVDLDDGCACLQPCRLRYDYLGEAVTAELNRCRYRCEPVITAVVREHECAGCPESVR